MKNSLTPLERIKRTLEFKEVDTVATGEIIQSSELISRFAGRKVNNDWTLDELIQTYRGLQIDLGMLIAPASTPRIEDRNGIKYHVTYWSEWVVERPFNDLDGLQKYLEKLILDVESSEPQDIWSYAGRGGIVGQYFKDYKSYFQDLKRRMYPTIPCHIESPVGLDVIYNIAGWELFSYMLADNPGLISESFEVLNDHEIQRVHLVADNEISPLVVVYCDIASNQDIILSPEYLKEEFFPRLKRLVNAWHEHDVKVIFHSEGNIKKVMDDLVACEIDGINPLEPGNISLQYTRENYPDLILWGGIDDKELLCFGSTEQVEEEVMKALRICKDGGFILGASGQIHPATNADNAIALYRAAKKYVS